MTVVRGAGSEPGVTKRAAFDAARAQGALWYAARADGSRVTFYRRSDGGVSRAVARLQSFLGAWTVGPWEPDGAAPALGALLPLPDRGAPP